MKHRHYDEPNSNEEIDLFILDDGTLLHIQRVKGMVGMSKVSLYGPIWQEQYRELLNQPNNESIIVKSEPSPS